jgi:hypothetical protein
MSVGPVALVRGSAPVSGARTGSTLVVARLLAAPVASELEQASASAAALVELEPVEAAPGPDLPLDRLARLALDPLEASATQPQLAASIRVQPGQERWIVRRQPA